MSSLLRGFYRVHRIGRDHHSDPQVEDMFCARVLVGGEFDRCSADPAAADAGFLHARHALRQQRMIRALDRACHPVDRHRIHERLQQQLGLLAQQPGGFPGGVADDVTAVGHVVRGRVRRAPPS